MIFLRFKNNFNKIIFCYFCYCLIFILMHLMLTSVLSFFHFLLDHEMGVIENWLSLNGWEILVVAKVLTLTLMVNILEANSNEKKSFLKELSFLERIPTKKTLALILFLLVMFSSLLNQFGGGIESNQILDQLFFSSYLGSILFYSLDIFYLIFIANFLKLELKNSLMTVFLCLCLFFVSSKVVLPYTGKYAVFLIVHFLLLFYLASRQNLGDIVAYLALVVAPLSSFFGVDLIWDNSYSIFTYSKQLPVIGVLLIWSVALVYLQRDQQD